MQLTALWGSFFLAVLGVLPRSLPGVLKTSVRFLRACKKMNSVSAVKVLHLLLTEDVAHVLVEPFQLVSCGITEFLNFLLNQFVRVLSFFLYPL